MDHRIGITVLCLAMLFGPSAMAGPLEDGKAAFEAGDFERAGKVLTPLAQGGDRDAEALLGVSLLFQPKADTKQAVAWLTKASDAGSGEAAYALGLAHLQGWRGFHQDPEASLRWFQLAATRGGESEAYSLLWLSTLYRAGVAGPINEATISDLEKKAAVELESAASKGSIGAQSRLAAMYHDGQGVPKDEARATQLLQQVAATYRFRAERGDVLAQVKMADLYKSGRGVPPDPAMTIYWLRRAADQGEQHAQEELWFIYFNASQSVDAAKVILGDDGTLSDQDRIEAYVWQHLSGLAAQTAAMMPKVAAERAELQSGLSPADKAAADARIKTWLPAKETVPPDDGPVPISVPQKAEADRMAAEDNRLKYANSAAARDEAARRVAAYDMALGSNEAKVTVIEYSSPGSPHSAKWHRDEFEKFKRAYIDTDKVHYVFREVSFPGPDFEYTAFSLARCRGPDAYFPTLALLFENAGDLAKQSDWRSAFALFAKTSLGIDSSAFDSCVDNPTARKAFDNRTAFHEIVLRDLNGGGVPAFVVNGKAITGDVTAKSLGLAIDAAQAAR